MIQHYLLIWPVLVPCEFHKIVWLLLQLMFCCLVKGPSFYHVDFICLFWQMSCFMIKWLVLVPYEFHQIVWLLMLQMFCCLVKWPIVLPVGFHLFILADVLLYDKMAGPCGVWISSNCMTLIVADVLFLNKVACLLPCGFHLFILADVLSFDKMAGPCATWISSNHMTLIVADVLLLDKMVRPTAVWISFVYCGRCPLIW